MRISFDIDDTLVCHGILSSRERGRLPRFVLNWLCEPLRAGTFSLLGELRSRGHSIWIYTTSARSPFHIRFWLFLHGIRVDGVVNEERHRRVGDPSRLPSKYPPAFGIDLHVDDSEGVRIEGERFGFKVLVVRPDDLEWTHRV